MRRSFKIIGRVQGVGFRWWTRERALSAGIRGTVRNLEDGSVLVEAEGEPATLDGFIEELRKGPPTAVVSDLLEVEPTDHPPYEDFRIVH